jgi:hypothetical protein
MIQWPELIYGSVIGGLVGFTVHKAFEFISSVRKNTGFPYLGTYHSYHYSTIGNGTIRHQLWKIKRSLSGEVHLLITEPYHEDEFCFKGTVWVEDRHIYALGKGVHHSERVFHIFPEPVTMRLGHTVGIGMALTIKKQPWSGKQIISDKTLNELEVKDMLGKEQRIVSNFA